MSARQNKRQRTKRNPNIHRERTVTTLTGNDDNEHSFVVSPLSDEQPSSFSTNMMPTGLPFGFNNFVGPINAGMHPQQQPYYLQQQSMLPPGQNDLEILENLKDTIKRGQNPFFRAVPNPAALASIYLGSSNAEQTSRVDAQATSISEKSSNDDQGRRPHMQGKEAWDSPRKLSVSSGQNNANAVPQGSADKLSQESVLKENSKSSEGGGPNGLSTRPPPSSAGKDERPLGRETYPPPTSRDSDRTAPPPSSASVASSPSSNAPTARDSSSRYHDSRDRDRDLRDRDRDWDRDNYPYRRDDRRVSDARRPDYDARPHESNYPPRRYDSKDDYAGNDRRRDDRLPPRPDPSRLDLPPRPDDRYPPRPDERLPPRPDDRYSHRSEDRIPYDRLSSRPDDRTPHRPDDRPHRYDDRRFDRPIIGESPVAAAAAAERDRAAAAAAAGLPPPPPPPPPSRPSASSRPPLPPSSGSTRPLEDRGAGRLPPPPPPPVVDSKAPSARPPPKLEERISRAPTLQERLTQPPATTRVVEPPTRTLSLEERLSHAPIANNSATATAQSDDRRSNASDRDRPGTTTRPDERSSSTASSTGRGGAAETSRPLPPSVPDDRNRPAATATITTAAPRVPTDEPRGRTMDRFASRGTTPAPARPAGAPAVPPAAPSYSRAASVAQDDSRRASPVRHDSYRSSVPPPPRDHSRDRQVNPRAGPHSYRPGDDRAYGDRHRDTMDVDPPSSSRYANGEYSRRVASPSPLPPRRAGYPPSPPPTRLLDSHTYDDRDRRLSGSGGRDYAYDSDRRRDWPPAEDDPYYKSRPAYPPPPPDRYDRDTREMAPPPRSATWDSRSEHDRRTSSGPATGSSYHTPTRSPPPRSSSAIPESSSARPLSSRLDYPPDDRDRPYPPRADIDRPRYSSSVAGDSSYSRVRPRSPSPARRPAIDDRPPVKRAREDMYPSSGSGGHYPPPPSSYSRDVPSAPRRPSDYPPPRSGTPPTSGGYYPPPGSSADRDYRRDYPGPYDRPRSPPRGGVSGGYVSSSSYRSDSRDDRRYMPPPPPPR